MEIEKWQKKKNKNKNKKGFSRNRSFWHKAGNLWSLFPPIKLSELTPIEQAERVNLFLLGFACIFLINVVPILIKVSATFSEYEDQHQLEIKSNIIQRQIKGRCN